MHRILLIDQGDSSLRNIEKPLSDKGYHLLNEQNLTRACQILRENNIDLIAIHEAAMPRLEKSSRFHEVSSSIPKILLKGPAEGNQRTAFRRNGIFPVAEPFTTREFITVVKKILQARDMENMNSVLRDEVKRQENKIRYIDDISKMLITSSDINHSLPAIMDKTRIMTGAASCTVLLNDEILFQMISLRPSKKIIKLSIDSDKGLTGRVLSTGKPVAIADVSKDRRFSRKFDGIEGLKIRAFACAPLKFKNRVVGVIRLANRKNKDTFTDDDLDLLTSAAGYAALAIERAFLYEKLKNDELTNLFNIRYLNQAIAMEIERSRRYQYVFSVIFMDMDNFKKINDRFGHLVGSQVLIEIARLLQRNLRKIDIISRYGGDEFVVVLPQTGLRGGFHVAERLRKEIEHSVFLKSEGYSIRLTASLGVASYPENAGNKEDLINLADRAMYRGKFMTKNIVFAAK